MVYSDWSALDFFRWNHQNSKFTFQSKVIIKKLLKMTKIATLPKNAKFSNYQRYRISNFDATNWRLKWINILISYFLYFPRNKKLKSVTVRSGRIIVLNNSASPKMAIKMYFNFFNSFLKVLELFECRRGNPYITVNRIFVHYADS